MDWMWTGLSSIEVRDWAAIAGTIVAALIGVGALWIVFGVEQRARYNDRVDRAFEDVIRATGRRALELQEYGAYSGGDIMSGFIASQRRAGTGGPLDADLQAATEIALMACTKRRDRTAAKAVADTTWSMKRAVIAWQIPHWGEIAAAIRRWRTREISAGQLLNILNELDAQIIASEAAYVERTNES